MIREMDADHGSRDAEVMSPPADGSAPESEPGTRETAWGWRGLLRRALGLVLGLVAAVLFLGSWILLDVTLALTPYPGSDLALLIVKTVDFGGWLAIGGWLFVDWSHARLRVLLSPVIAWAWLLVLGSLASGLGFLSCAGP